MQNNQIPVAPATMPTGDQMIAFIRQQAAQIRGGNSATPAQGVNAINPYIPEETPDNSDTQHASNIEKWTSPIRIHRNDSSNYDDSAHENFLSNLEQDPAVQEYGDDFHNYLEGLMMGVQSGRIDQQQAQELGQNYLDTIVKPIIEKHHGKTGRNPEKDLHRKPAPVIPDIVKKARGIK